MLYLELLKRCLVNSIYPEYSNIASDGWIPKAIIMICRKFGVELVKPVDPKDRTMGIDWPKTAHTMVGVMRLNNLQACVEDVIKNHIPGDFIETGVWRGGSCILMRGILKVYGISDRKVWVADSFQGFKGMPESNVPIDKGYFSSYLNNNEVLGISIEEVKNNFTRYGLLDDQVQFLKGWFSETLSRAPLGPLAIARLDGDLYKSTMDALVPLYPKLSVGGYLIVDDYGAVEACKQAVDVYRKQQGITEPVIKIDESGIFWKKTR